MTDDRLGRALRSIGDEYVRENPADFATLRAAVQRKTWRRRLLATLGATTVTATAVIAGVLFLSTDRGTDPVVPPAGEPDVIATFNVGPVTEVAAGLESAFVVDPTAATVTRVDPSDAEVWTTALAAAPTDIIHTKTEIWVSVSTDNAIYSLDRDSGEATRVDVFPFTRPTRIHVGEFAIRAVTDQGVIRIPKDALEPELLYRGSVRDIALGPRGLWVLGTDGSLRALDPDTAAQVPIEADQLEAVQSEITYLKQALWFGSPGSTTLTRIDESTGMITDRIELPGGYVDIEAGRDALWVLVETESGGRLIEADPTDGSLGSVSVALEDTPRDLSTDDSSVWITLANGNLLRVEG